MAVLSAARRGELETALNRALDTDPEDKSPPTVDPASIREGVALLRGGSGPHIIRAAFENPGDGLVTRVEDLPPELPASARRDAARWLTSGQDPEGRSWALVMVDGRCVTAASQKGDAPVRFTTRHNARSSERISLHVPGVTVPTFTKAALNG